MVLAFAPSILQAFVTLSFGQLVRLELRECGIAITRRNSAHARAKLERVGYGAGVLCGGNES